MRSLWLPKNGSAGAKKAVDMPAMRLPVDAGEVLRT